jgi:hypothetical protein
MAKWMQGGEWHVDTADPLRFDCEKYLRNGQHRLNAQLIAGMDALEYYVVTGLDPAAFIYMDRGRKRTAAQTFAIMGVDKPTTITPVLNMLEGYRINGLRGNYSCEPKHMYDLYIKVYTDLQQYIMTKKERLAKLMNPTVASFFNYTLRHSNREVAEKFIAKIIGDEPTSMGDPAYALRNRCIEGKAKPESVMEGTRSKDQRLRRLNSEVLARVVAKAWSFELAGKQISQIRLSKPECDNRLIIDGYVPPTYKVEDLA